MAISISDRLRWYKRDDVQDALVGFAEDAEIAVKYGDKGFGKRPDVLLRPADVLAFAQQGATSFHCSEERWVDPQRIVTGMARRELDDLRKSWDLILDIDCPLLEYSAIAADVLVHALRHMGIQSLTAKFSGNHGFHIAVPFEAFPDTVQGVPTQQLFPEGPRKIAAYLKSMMRPVLAREMLAYQPVTAIAGALKMPLQEVAPGGAFDPFKVLEIDTVLIASRHLYRMCYSFNEKSGLLSLPVDTRRMREFDKGSATPDRAAVGEQVFLVRKGADRGEAKKLILQAFDTDAEHVERKRIVEDQRATAVRQDRTFDEVITKIPEHCFPPCIKQHISAGLKDGKKRAVFILINFLQSAGWDAPDIEAWLREWNKRNPEPLREQDLVGPLRYHKGQKKTLPPNCANEAYYKSLGVCHPDGLCAKIKNPVNYAIVKQRMLANEQPARKKKDSRAETPKQLPQATQSSDESKE